MLRAPLTLTENPISNDELDFRVKTTAPYAAWAALLMAHAWFLLQAESDREPYSLLTRFRTKKRICIAPAPLACVYSDVAWLNSPELPSSVTCMRSS